MKRIGLLFLCIVFLLPIQLPLWAQLSQGGVPATSLTQLRSASEVLPVISLAPPTKEKIEQLLSEPALGFRNTYIIGEPLGVHITPENSGTQSMGTNNNLIWQLVLESPFAEALQIYFSRFHLPEGARLFLISPSTGEIKGAFGAHNNTTEESLAVSPVRGDRVIVHYEAPANDYTLPELEIGSVSYCFRTIAEDPMHNIYGRGEPWFMGGYSCAPNVVSHPEVEEISRSQVLMMVRGKSVCSGALINNTAKDGTAYVLTAAHCMNGSFKYPNDKAYRDESARQTIFFFNFRSPVGDRFIRATEEQSLSGATIVAWDEEHDLCLLRITGVQNTDGGIECGIPASYRPYFSGWNIGSHQPPYVGLHHPSASVTRYNQALGEVELSSFTAGSTQWTDSHWRIKKWDIGTTAPGSSGSPLYDSQNLIIGALTGGNSYCATPVNDYYYAISRCWAKEGVVTEQLKPFLDPINTQSETCTGFDPYTPKSPRRLSNNLYSLSRDAIEETNGKLGELTAVASQYMISDSSKLLGVMIVASPMVVFNKNKLLIMEGDENGPTTVVHTQEIQHPLYQSWNPEVEPRERTIGGFIEFFVHLNRELTFSKNSIIYVGVERTEGVEGSLIPIVRMKHSAQNAHTAWVKTSSTADNWISHNSSVLPSHLNYRGSYWIDLLTHPLEVSEVTPSIDEERPTIVLVEGRLRITLPDTPSEPIPLSLYDLNGVRLFSTSIDYKVGEWDLSPHLSNLHWVVISYVYKGGRYSALVPLFVD